MIEARASGYRTRVRCVSKCGYNVRKDLAILRRGSGHSRIRKDALSAHFSLVLHHKDFARTLDLECREIGEFAVIRDGKIDTISVTDPSKSGLRDQPFDS